MYKYYNCAVDKLLPYFECDVDNNDNAYYKSDENIKKIFSEHKIIRNKFIEKSKVELRKVFGLLKSWSSYVNYKNIHPDNENDPINHLKESLMKFYNLNSYDELDKIEVDYYNYYFTVSIRI